MVDIDDLRIDLPDRKPRKRRRSSAPAVFGTLAIVIAAVWFLGLGHKLNPPPQVQIFEIASGVQSTVGDGEISAGGYLEVKPPGPVVVSVLVEGKVSALSTLEGDTIEKGTVIAQLDSSLYMQEIKLRNSAVEIARRKLERMEAGFRTEEIAQANADLSSALATLNRVEAEYARAESLFESGVLAQRQLDETKAELATARSNVAMREAELNIKRQGARREDVEIARAELNAELVALERAKWNAGQCTIKAPVSGIVLERYVQVGDWISPSYDSETPGALFSIMEPGTLQAWVDVNQREMAGVTIGQSVALTTDSDPSREIKGQVAAILPKANLQKNTIQAKIEIFDPPAYLLPDMSVKVAFKKSNEPEVDTIKNENMVKIPLSAIVYSKSNKGVFVLRGNKAIFRKMDIAKEDESYAYVTSGLNLGDKVVINPEGISDGETVVIN